MATTQATNNNRNRETTYALLVVFSVDAHSDAHLQDRQAIRDEAQSWIESLDATVKGVCIRKA